MEKKLRTVLRKADLPRFVGLGRSQIDKLIELEQFPKGAPASDTGRADIWDEQEVIAWQEQQFAKRDDPVFMAERRQRKRFWDNKPTSARKQRTKKV